MKTKILVLAPLRIDPSISVLKEGKLSNVLNVIRYGGVRQPTPTLHHASCWLGDWSRSAHRSHEAGSFPIGYLRVSQFACWLATRPDAWARVETRRFPQGDTFPRQPKFYLTLEIGVLDPAVLAQPKGWLKSPN
jgi:hypothetical protein